MLPILAKWCDQDFEAQSFIECVIRTSVTKQHVLHVGTCIQGSLNAFFYSANDNHSAMCLIDAIVKPDNHFACSNDYGDSISPYEAIY